MPEHLQVRTDDAVRTLVLDRPGKRNALDPPLVTALREALAVADEDPDVRGLVLAAEGPVFCAGGDLDDMRARRGDGMATRERQRTGFGALARTLLTATTPTVARVQGDAHGAGCMLAVSCDVVVAAEDARFGLGFARVGLMPDTGGTWLLPRLVGLRAARELVLRSAVVDAERAVGLGLASEVVPADELDDTVDATARELADGPSRALGLAKEGLLRGAVSELDDALAFEALGQGLCFTTDDHAEAVDALRQDREPAFEGR